MIVDISAYLKFAMEPFIAFGHAFNVLIAALVAVKIGLVCVKSLREACAYVVVCTFVLGAIFTSLNVIAQLMLAMPLLLLYEAGV